MLIEAPTGRAPGSNVNTSHKNNCIAAYSVTSQKVGGRGDVFNPDRPLIIKLKISETHM
jgi:hypothetical protein